MYSSKQNEKVMEVPALPCPDIESTPLHAFPCACMRRPRQEVMEQIVPVGREEITLMRIELTLIKSDTASKVE